MTWAPHVTVATIVEQDGRYLLVHEHSEQSIVYNQPAGHLEAGESLPEAAVRETLEETGWLVKPKAVLGCTLFTSPYNNITYYRTTFIADAIEFNAELELDTDIIEAVWLTYDEVLAKRSQLRSPIVLKDIEAYRNGQTFPLELIKTYP